MLADQPRLEPRPHRFTEVVGSVARATPYFRGKARIVDRLVPRGGFYRASVFGFPMCLDLGDLIQRQVFLGYYERRDAALVRALLKPGMSVVDAGANIGFYSALASRLVGPNGVVVAFEPSERVYRILESWARFASNVRCQQVALGLSNGELELFVPPAELGNHDPSVIEYCSGMERISVNVRRLDDVLGEMGINTVDLLKVDVEGNEPALFEGCERLLMGHRLRHILCELNDPLLRAARSSPQQLARQLESFGYQMRGELPQPGGISNVLFSPRATQP